MHVQRWMRIKLRRLLPIVAALSLMLGGAVATEVAKATPAHADTTVYNSLSYPWSSAPCEFGANGGSSCANPDQKDYPGDKYDWYENGGNAFSGSLCWYNSNSECFDSWGYEYRNCASYVAWQLAQYGVPTSDLTDLGNGGTWYDKASVKGLSVGTTPKVNAAAVVPGNSSNPFGHVAFVTAVNSDGTITVQEYNHDAAGDGDTWTGPPSDRGFTEYVYFGQYMTNPPSSTPPPVHSSTILKLKKVIDSDGTQNVYFTTTSDIYQAWWNSTSNGVQRASIYHTDANNIVDMDAITQPDGTKSVYAAVPNGIVEIYWNSSTSPHAQQIISDRTGVIKVIATSEIDNGVYTHVLYVLTTSGPWQYWWQDGGTGIHETQLTTINGSVAFSFTQAPDGTDQLYTANAGAVYETWWKPGVTAPATNPIISIPQNNIKSVYKIIAPDGTNELYTGTTVGVWQSEWGGHVGALTNTYPVNNFAGSSGVMKVFNPNGAEEIYASDGYNVEQYWSTSTGSGGGSLIYIPQGSIVSFDVDYLNGVGQLYTAEGAYIYETYWDASGIHNGPPIVNAN